MDCYHYSTELSGCKRGQHLQREERGVIQALKRQGQSNKGYCQSIGLFSYHNRK